MFNKFGKVIIEHHLTSQMIDFNSGVEVERFRIDKKGNTSPYPYPKGIGNQSKNPWITNDYLETMSEVITPPASYYLDSIHYIHTLSELLRQHLDTEELLWPLSMPPKLPQVRNKSLLANTDNPVKRQYLEYLVDKYGISHGTPCGIHINVSFNHSMIRTIAATSSMPFENEEELNNYVYQLVAIGFMQFRWFLTYLLGASPVSEDNYFEADDEQPNTPIRSLRQSHYGFITSFPVDYTNVNAYVDKIKQGLADGELANEAEFHGPIRFKGNDLKHHGVKYIELRMLDLDPFADSGIKASTLMLIQLMSCYFAMNEELTSLNGVEQTIQSDQMNEQVACEHPGTPCKYQKEAHKFLEDLRQFVNTVDLGPEYLELLDYFVAQVKTPELTVNGKLLKEIHHNSLVDFGVKQAQIFQDAANQTCYRYDFFEKNDDYSIANLKSQLFKGTFQAQ